MYVYAKACLWTKLRPRVWTGRQYGESSKLEERGRRKKKNRRMKARKKGREKERKGLSLWLAFDDASRASAGHFGRPLFIYFFFYLIYIHDRVSHDDIGLWDWITHIRHAMNIHIHIHLHVQVERSPKLAVLRTAGCRERETYFGTRFTRDKTRRNAGERERMGGRERERVKGSKRDGRKKR